MNYAIFHVITGQPRIALQNLKNEIGKKFKFQPIQYESFPHLTIKYDFETEDVGPIEKIVKNVCSSHKSTGIEIMGIDTFDRRVIFLKAEGISQLEKIYTDLFERLKTITWLTWEPYEGINYRPHFTLAYKQLNGNNFDQVLSFVKKKKIYISINFNNLAITKIVNKERKIYKFYKLR